MHQHLALSAPPVNSKQKQPWIMKPRCPTPSPSLFQMVRVARIASALLSALRMSTKHPHSQMAALRPVPSQRTQRPAQTSALRSPPQMSIVGIPSPMVSVVRMRPRLVSLAPPGSCRRRQRLTMKRSLLTQLLFRFLMVMAGAIALPSQSTSRMSTRTVHLCSAMTIPRHGLLRRIPLRAQTSGVLSRRRMRIVTRSRIV